MQLGVASFVSGVICCELDNSLRLGLVKSDVNIRLVVGGGFVEEVNLDITVVKLFDEINAAISLAENEKTNVVFDRDVDVRLVV